MACVLGSGARALCDDSLAETSLSATVAKFASKPFSLIASGTAIHAEVDIIFTALGCRYLVLNLRFRSNPYQHFNAKRGSWNRVPSHVINSVQRYASALWLSTLPTWLDNDHDDLPAVRSLHVFRRVSHFTSNSNNMSYMRLHMPARWALGFQDGSISNIDHPAPRSRSAVGITKPRDDSAHVSETPHASASWPALNNRTTALRLRSPNTLRINHLVAECGC